MNFLLVGVGGALGAMARYGLGRLIAMCWTTSFPLATMLINIIGSMLMGLLMAYAPAEDWWGRPLLAVGVLGGFTTFSSFSLEAITLIHRGAWTQAVLYIGGSVLLSLLGLAAGLRIGQA